MSSPQRLTAALIGAALLLGSTGCQGSTPDPQGGTGTTRNAEMPPLPEDPHAAEAVVRTMMMDEAIVLLKASGLKYTEAQPSRPLADWGPGSQWRVHREPQRVKKGPSSLARGERGR